MIRCLGRTGSTWLMRLLGQHPEVLVYRPFEYEPRLVSYWIEVLRRLGHPRAGLAALRPSGSEALWWLGQGSQPDPLPACEVRRRRGLEARGTAAVRGAVAISSVRVPPKKRPSRA
jgi:hypothetical protein